MFYTLDRTEDNNIAVLIDDDGKKYDIPLENLPEHDGTGSVFREENGVYLFDKEETDRRRISIAEKRRRLFDRIKK